MTIAQEISCPTNSFFPYRELPSDLSNITVEVDDERPWLATVTEVLNTAAPANAQPYCCYINTVIFYEKPYREIDGRYAEHDSLKTVLEGNDILRADGELFELYGGEVKHIDGRWVMVRNARKVQK